MKASTLLPKIAAISCFLTLMTGFVAYRSGLMTELLYADSFYPSDTTKAKKDSLLQLQTDSMKRMYNMRATSKSGTIFVGSNAARPFDSTIERMRLDTIIKVHMSSSKSISPIIQIPNDTSK